MESSKTFDIPAVLKPDGEKRLARVFTFLRQHERKARLTRKVSELHALDAAQNERGKREERHGVHTQAEDKVPAQGVEEGNDEEQSQQCTKGDVPMHGLRLEIEELHKSINFKEYDTAGAITAADLSSALKTLNRATSKSDIQWMIWEVDDDLDGCIDWDEFRGAYARCIADRQGNEPNQLFHLIQFMLCDSDCSLFASVGELKDELRRLPGTDHLITKMAKAFKIVNDQQEQQKHSLAQYLDAMFADLPVGLFLHILTPSTKS